MGRFRDLTGMTFDRLTVVKRAEDYVSPSGCHSVQWLCQCECGKEVIIKAISLTSGVTKSCGCLSKDVARKQAAKNFKKYNSFKICDDYVVMYTLKNEPFYVDLEDFDKVKDICWWRRNDGYILGRVNGKTVRLHRYIMNCPVGYDVDHIHGKETRNNNRRSNLRITTRSQNNMNKGLQINNVSGVTGVSWDNYYQKWIAQIKINGKSIRLGTFKSFDDAVTKRKQAEEKYFGEYSYDNSQKYNTEYIKESNNL